ncbi:DUF397 domain-containing protein [Streptomyces mutabilis]|uniref:DUF397 domain-containing protein n=1 Tax=Streptomyces mutabilis TaxID=67332 RepID=UPI000A23C5E4|nr:hypothetical protein B5181_04010 [Streptomyces sp. 4F]PAM97965.1 hypothetical protein CJI59_31405 [Streptomyces sp. Alain-F2R5]
MAEDRGAVSWLRSTYSNKEGDDNCCEIATLPGEIRVRDSKSPETAVVSFAPETWGIALAWFSGRGDPGRSDD